MQADYFCGVNMTCNLLLVSEMLIVELDAAKFICGIICKARSDIYFCSPKRNQLSLVM